MDVSYPKLPASKMKSRPVISFSNGRGEWKKPLRHAMFTSTPRTVTLEHQSPPLIRSTGITGVFVLEPHPAQYLAFTDLQGLNQAVCVVGTGAISEHMHGFLSLHHAPVPFIENNEFSKAFFNFRKNELSDSAECILEIEQDLHTIPNLTHDFKFAHAILDENSMERLNSFSKLQDGWHLGGGKSLQSDSVRGFKIFLLASSQKLNLRNSSVFMTQEGYLQLSWNDEDGGDIELEFHASEIELYLEKAHEEYSCSYDELNQLIEKLSKIEKKNTAPQ